jgi:hypothetical protein
MGNIALKECCTAHKPPSDDGRPLTNFHLVYVETEAHASRDIMCDESTRDGTSSKHSDSSQCHRVRGMSVLQTVPGNFLAIPPAKLDKDKVAQFREVLHGHGIDTSLWGVNGAKSVEHLFWEVYTQKGSILTGMSSQGTLKRVTRLLKICLIADIFGVDHILVSRMQFMHDGQHIQRRQVPLKKLKWKVNSEDPLAAQCTEAFYAEDCPYVESWRSSCVQALQERLGLSERTLNMQFEEDEQLYSYHTEDNITSDGYPGLNTLYCVHQVYFRVVDPEHPRVSVLGLPHGQEFATADGDFNFNRLTSEDGVPIGSQLNIWSWSHDKKLLQPNAGKNQTSSPTSSPAVKTDISDKNVSAQAENQLRIIKRVPLPKLTQLNLAAGKASVGKLRAPNGELWSALEGQRTNWAMVRRMARSMMDADYSLTDFNQDLAAFPELSLYLRDGSGTSSTSSSRTVGDEYQRTIGAFFAIYWLMRMETDGRDGFTFGVDNQWAAILADKVKAQNAGAMTSCDDIPADVQQRLFNAERRLAFFNDAKWDFLKSLLIDAGLIEEISDKAGQPRKTGSGKKLFRVNERRLVSLLALTAIHDIMKMDSLLPTVQAEHAPYHGYAAGNVIGDHDHALSYLMDHYPEALPSFMDLDPVERRSVQFTQCNLCFNHGWFVQAEAPPGAIFTKFREVLIRDHKSEIGARDIALYFVHWLTDLAGAEPTPLGGCEKFVMKFPLPVLNSFLRSFKYVEQIAHKTETEVMEQYLQYRWAEHVPPLGPVPTGNDAIAKMRLVCMAQASAPAVVRAFDRELPAEDKEVLNLEMSRTGCMGQHYSANLVPPEVRDRPAGPAFLIYYGPAFLQTMGSDPPLLRLRILTEVYRCARALWPESLSRVATSVHVRIDTIKGLSCSEIKEALSKGDLWLLTQHNNSEAFVERSSHRKLNRLITNGQSFQILDLACLSDFKK